MAEIDDAIYDAITAKTDIGNAYMDKEEWHEAIAVFNDALALLPEPKTDWSAYMWITASIGDAYFSLHDYVNAEQAFLHAAHDMEGQQNPFVMLRLGQVSFERGDMVRADDALMRAYLLVDISVFDGEDPKYLQYMQAKFNIV